MAKKDRIMLCCSFDMFILRPLLMRILHIGESKNRFIIKVTLRYLPVNSTIHRPKPNVVTQLSPVQVHKWSLIRVIRVEIGSPSRPLF